TARAGVPPLGDGALASGVGASGRDAATRVFGSRGTYSVATLSYVGAGASTDRHFTMSGNAELLSDGSGALTWTGSPLVTVGERMLRLGGTQAGLFTGLLADGGGRLSIAKHGTGTWRL